MKVKDLIDSLKNFDPDLDVMINVNGEHSGEFEISDVHNQDQYSTHVWIETLEK